MRSLIMLPFLLVACETVKIDGGLDTVDTDPGLVIDTLDTDDLPDVPVINDDTDVGGGDDTDLPDTDAVETDAVETDTPAETDDSDVLPVRGIAAVLPGELLISEVMSNPDVCGDDDGEYVEVTWLGPGPADLGGLELHDNTDVAIVPSPWPVVAGDRILFAKANLFRCYGISPDVPMTLALSNSGELLFLEDPSGRRLDEIDTDTINTPDGVAAERDDADPGFWCDADGLIGTTTDYGSPGIQNGLCGAVVGPGGGGVPVGGVLTADLLGLGDLVITEFMADPDACSDETGEYVEVVYTGLDPADLGGLEIADNGNSWAVPNGTVVQPGERFLFVRNPGARPQCYGLQGIEYSAMIGLSGAGDVIALSGPTGRLINRVDFQSWTVPQGVAWERDDADPSVWCVADTLIAGSIDYGSPGNPNGACPP